jgi:hypothetical protein
MAKKIIKKRTGFDELNDKLDRVIINMATSDDIARLDARIDKLDSKFERRFNDVMTAIDGLAKAVSDLTVEYASVKMQLDRHEDWIKLLAKKADIKLPSR